MIDKEFCLYFRKGITLTTTYGSAKTYWITPTNVADKKKYNHPTIKPLWIIENLVRNSSAAGDTVLDCFMGSGTTGVACKKNNRKFIGVELDKSYFEVAIPASKEKVCNTNNVKVSYIIVKNCFCSFPLRNETFFSEYHTDFSF